MTDPTPISIFIQILSHYRFGFPIKGDLLKVFSISVAWKANISDSTWELRVNYLRGYGAPPLPHFLLNSIYLSLNATSLASFTTLVGSRGSFLHILGWPCLASWEEESPIISFPLLSFSFMVGLKSMSWARWGWIYSGGNTVAFTTCLEPPKPLTVRDSVWSGDRVKSSPRM